MNGAGGCSGGIGQFFIGVISSVRFNLRTMTSFELIVIFI
jgi:hypothetical protein